MRFETAAHWIEFDGKEATIGLSETFQADLEEIVYIELPKEGTLVQKDQDVALLESTKAAVDVSTPLSGFISKTNTCLSSDPLSIHKRPQNETWLFKINNLKEEEINQFLNLNNNGRVSKV
jgi:glycine cleavage system H protein